MDSAAMLIDAFDRVREAALAVGDGLTQEQLTYRVDPQANTIAWLLWHLARVQDAQVADVAGEPEVWVAQGWAGRFDLPFPPGATGYGQSPEEVGRVRAPVDLLTGYLSAVAAQTAAYLGRLADRDLEVVVDERWDPPVTLGVRLVSILADDLQHVGQAAYLRGVVERLAA